jgi:mono/diheme cytochrome c family protein
LRELHNGHLASESHQIGADMNRYLKWAGLSFGGFVIVIIVVVAVLMLMGGSRFNRTYDIQVAAVNVPADAASIEWGKHFVEAIGVCQECHGDDLSGDLFIDDPLFATVVASNLTSGKGGIGAFYSDIDYVRAIRHGVGHDGKGLPIMPSDVFNRFSDEDLGAIISYLKSLPPVDNELPESKPGPIGRVIILLEPSLFPVNLIDHTAARPPGPTAAVTEQYGEYLSGVCTVCHGKDFGGAQPPDEGSSRAPNLTSGGPLATWSEMDLIKTLRTGITPTGRILNPDFMFWLRFRLMTDDEIKAIWLYLGSLPPVTAGG